MPAAQHYETSAKYAVSPADKSTGQGSTNCAILPSRMEAHGLSWENMEKIENMEKTENINQMS